MGKKIANVSFSETEIEPHYSDEKMESSHANDFIYMMKSCVEEVSSAKTLLSRSTNTYSPSERATCAKTCLLQAIECLDSCGYNERDEHGLYSRVKQSYNILAVKGEAGLRDCLSVLNQGVLNEECDC